MLANTMVRVVLSLAAAAAVCASGCMTHPGNGQYIGKKHYSIQFSGFCQNPNESVAVWARINGGGWQHLGTVKSANWPIQHQGSNWYSWAHTTVVPSWCWRAGPGFSAAELAATNYKGDMYTFNQGFGNYFAKYSSILDMYNAEGAGTRVTVYADP